MTTLGCLTPILAFFLFFLGISSSVSTVPVPIEPTVTPSSKGILAISALPKLDPTPVNFGQAAVDAIDLAYRSGARGMHLAEKWSVLEPSPGKYNLMGLANDINYLGQRGFTVQLALQVVNTTAKETPADLLPMSFSSRKLMAYYGLPGNTGFYEFLCTLGLRKANGIPKQAWSVFQSGAER
jgi:hypothetical protein